MSFQVCLLMLMICLVGTVCAEQTAGPCPMSPSGQMAQQSFHMTLASDKMALGFDNMALESKMALGSDKMALGSDKMALGSDKMALGSDKMALGFDKMALESKMALGSDKMALGFDKMALESKMALGSDKKALGSDKMALGSDKKALGSDKMALGSDKIALGSDKMALGSDKMALGSDKKALGSDKMALGSDKIALGSDKMALGSDKAMGSDKKALGSDKMALGSDKMALGSDKMALGSDKIALGSDKMALGSDKAMGSDKKALGSDKMALGSDKMALGSDKMGRSRVTLGTQDGMSPQSAAGANILILHPIYAGSHELILRRFGEELVKRGHRVTQVRWRSSKTRQVSSTVDVVTLSPNNRDLRYPYMERDGTFQPPTSMLWQRPRHMWQIPIDVFRLMDAHCLTLLGQPSLASHLRNANYSLAIVDIMGNECSLALAYSLGLPIIGFWGFSFQGGESRASGVFQSPALVPSFLSEVGASMTFMERVWNTLVMLAETAVISYHFAVIDSNIKRLVPSCPGSRDLLREMEVILVHSHWIVDYPKLMPPHVQYIGCIQCGPPDPLPHKFDRWVSQATAGVVVFSLGYTGFEANSVPEHVMDAFISAFSRLSQRVLLRFNTALLPYVPDNVMVVDWFPQHDILGHHKTVLFVTHCGQNGINEAVYHGVPIVAVPVFADQGDNARRIVDRGLGVSIDKNTITEEVVYSAIITVLNDTRYRQTAARFSALWKEEGKSGVERGAQWVELVYRHGQLTHLRMPGGHLSFSQYFALDVAGFLMALALAPCYLVCWLWCRKKKIIFKKEKNH